MNRSAATHANDQGMPRSYHIDYFSSQVVSQHLSKYGLIVLRKLDAFLLIPKAVEQGVVNISNLLRTNNRTSGDGSLDLSKISQQLTLNR